MTNSIFEPKIILPRSLSADDKILALAEALNHQLKNISGDVKEVLHLPRLEELSGSILDILNWQFHADFYEPLVLSDVEKRALIRQAVYLHRIKGTKYAVELMCASIFRDAEISEWFEYGGAKYGFKITTQGFKYLDDMSQFLGMINSVKNVRSWLMELNTDYSRNLLPIKLHVAEALTKIGFNRFQPHVNKFHKNVVKVGNALTLTGGKNFSVNNPKLPSRHLLRVGQSFIKGGEVIIFADERDKIPWRDINENAIADILIADWGIARRGRLKPPVENRYWNFNLKPPAQIADATFGVKTFAPNIRKKLFQPVKLKNQLKVEGDLTIKNEPRITRRHKVTVKVGGSFHLSGCITILPERRVRDG